MQFLVPQFVSIENRIIGPLTLNQFIYLAIPAVISYFLYFPLANWLWIVIAGILMGIGSALAFAKINTRPLPAVIKAAAYYLIRPKAYVWPAYSEEKIVAVTAVRAPAKPSLTTLFERITTSISPVPKREMSFEADFIRNQNEWRQRYAIIQKITGEKESVRRIDYR
ncbi:MAG TPA: PrgI family protein [Candidatus Colwellbacteria bacterium]|nr:PrgI family protein [Candidatus Colwellbacteria bacterium]HQA95869.1 PrgI family protein [Candidatus Colwellbacteria bacterium]